MAKKVIIFDFDGTIADSLPVVFEIINEFARREGFEKISEEKIYELRDLPASHIFKQIGISKLKFPFFLKKFRENFGKRISSIKAISSISENIKKLKEKNYILGIVTSNSYENVKKFCKNNNLDIFDFIYSDESIFSKDKILKRLLKKYNFEGGNVLYVGDEIRDIEAAKKSGIRMLAVGWGFNSKKALLENNPDYFIDDPSELIPAEIWEK
ncbi:MAG TPA: carotenoid oxygenase [Candidatus Moranbacteria bacterium]|nr:carotenoid oxygenase [Candidatus Moranbacteria bacterium]